MAISSLWIYPLKTVIFNSYVKLPEDNLSHELTERGMHMPITRGSWPIGNTSPPQAARRHLCWGIAISISTMV